ncbi:MAG: ABC transporter permease subunit [Actinomycetota bacterium]
MHEIFVAIFLSIPLIGAYAIFALGISVIYRASRVLNLAHGAMAMFPAFVSYQLVKWGAPIGIALFVAVIVGAILGIGVEYIFVRRLRGQGSTAQTVGTIAAAGLVIAFSAKIWGSSGVNGPKVFPTCIAHRCYLELFGEKVVWGAIGLFLVGLAVALTLFIFFKRTDYGLAMRGAAENRRAASLMGINPNITASAAWALGGGLAALAGVMLGAVQNIDPYYLPLQMLPAFVAILIGGLESMPGAILGSVIAGLTIGLQPDLARIPGIKVVFGAGGGSELLLTILALVTMALRGGRFSGVDTSSGGSIPKPMRRPKARGRLKISPIAIAGFVVLMLFPFVAANQYVGDAVLALEYAIVAFSLVILIGWVGQISLAQAAFVGLGAFITAMAARGWGFGFPFNVIVGAIAAAAVAIILGLVALRVRGLYLAVATLIFGWMAEKFLFTSPWLGAAEGASTIPQKTRIIGVAGSYPAIDLTKNRWQFFVFLAVVVLLIVGLSNLRDTKVGRAFFAIRGSELAAASLGIDVVRSKMIAFSLSGLIAGIGGGIIAVQQGTILNSQFFFNTSLFYLAVAVVGGLSSLGGAVAAGVLFASLHELFYSVRFLSGWLEVVSAGLLALVLLVYPGGLSAAGTNFMIFLDTARERRHKQRERAKERAEHQQLEPEQPSVEVLEPVLAAAGGDGDVIIEQAEPSMNGSSNGHRKPSLLAKFLKAPQQNAEVEKEDWLAMARASAVVEEPKVEVHETPAEQTAFKIAHLVGEQKPLPANRNERRPLVEAQGIVVRFSGLTAVDHANVIVKEGEIVGLIGPNGAGKTTLFNAILGLNSPAEGTVKLYGKDVTALPAHERAKMGVGRTFQTLQLFSELTVFDNLLVGTHLHNSSGLLSNLAGTSRSNIAEKQAKQRVNDVLDLLNLGDLAHEPARGLPFGILRMVELGRALVTGSRVLMLDEIASGLNNNETEELSQLILNIRSLGVSVLLIEHDVKMVVGVSDYMYVVEQGKPIADGPPAAVQRDPQVIAAYLGGDTHAEAEHAGV